MNVTLHNIAELVAEGSGHLLQRFPESVRQHMTDFGRAMARLPAGAEIRFVAGAEPVRVTLSASKEVSIAGAPRVTTYFGSFERGPVVTLTSEPQTLEIFAPPRWDQIPRQSGGFASNVIRLQLDGDPVVLHHIEGDVRPPTADELPGLTHLAYGTSITQGFSASRAPLCYAAQTATRIGADLRNLGCAGSAFCEPEMADYIAAQSWDVATLCLSVNMAASGVGVEDFRRIVGKFVATIADTSRPVVCISLLTYHHDIEGMVFVDSPQQAPADVFRDVLREIASKHPSATYVHGRDLLDLGGLTTDLVHPSDAGMLQIGERLAPYVAAALGT